MTGCGQQKDWDGHSQVEKTTWLFKGVENFAIYWYFIIKAII